MKELSEAPISRDWIESSVSTSMRAGWLTDGKRFKALCHVYKKVDWDILNALPPMTLYAPRFEYAGCVYQRTPTGLFIYFSPMLEFESQRRVDFVAAHEIAHAVLRHHEPGNVQMAEPAACYAKRPAELAADALAESWGFKRLKRDGRFEKLLNNGLLAHLDKVVLKDMFD
jgi:hypothetical protein